MPKVLQRISLIICFVTSLAMLSASVFGQEYRGRVQGNVMDSSKAAIAGATVTLLNIKTNLATVRETNEAGRYLFDLVDPGTYRLTVEVKGFNKFVQDNISVPSRADLTIDAELKPGDITETVSVTPKPRPCSSTHPSWIST